MASILVTGASRGLGHAFVSQLLTLPVDQISLVWAAARNPQHPNLQKLSQQHPQRLRLVQLDITDETSTSQAATQVSEESPNGGIDFLINNAAIMGKRLPITELDPEDLKTGLETNAIGCHRVTRAFLPLLRKGEKKVVVNLSAALASMGTKSEYPYWVVGTATTYRISKTALNMLTRQWAVSLESEGFTVAALHPGWVRTDMGGPLAPVSAKDAAECMAQLVLNLDPSRSGKFLKLIVPKSTDSATEQQVSEEMSW